APTERDAERLELDLVPTGAHAEHETAAADLVDGCRHLREDRRWMEHEAGHQRTQTHPLGDRRQTCQQRPGLPRSALRPATSPIEVVVADPDRVEANLLCGARHRDVPGPADIALDLGERDPAPERPPHAL